MDLAKMDSMLKYQTSLSTCHKLLKISLNMSMRSSQNFQASRRKASSMRKDLMELLKK
jgi:hypothetical protein